MKVPDIIREAAKKLRSHMTDSEIILWNHIKGGQLGVKFLRSLGKSLFLIFFLYFLP